MSSSRAKRLMLKVKVTPWHAYAVREGRLKYGAQKFTNPALKWAASSAPSFGRFIPGENMVQILKVVLRVVSEGCRKSHLYHDAVSCTVHPAASRYTAYAIPATAGKYQVQDQSVCRRYALLTECRIWNYRSEINAIHIPWNINSDHRVSRSDDRESWKHFYNKTN